MYVSHSLSMIRQGNSMPRESFQVDVTRYHALHKLASSQINKISSKFSNILIIIGKALQFEYKHLQLSMRLK